MTTPSPSDVVIIEGARSPIGRLAGELSSVSSTELGGHAISAALQRSGIDGAAVDYTFMGQVIAAGTGQVPARQAAFSGGIPLSQPSALINLACLSGMNAITLARRMIQCGEADIVVAGGMESMTNAPYLLTKARSGYRFGDDTLHDSMILDGLWCAFDQCAMGEGTERYAAATNIDRSRQDAFAARSHELAAAAVKNGLLAEEIEPVTIPQRRGDDLTVGFDEGIRVDTTAESLGRLRPAFSEDGNLTAGNSSQISDGAAAVVVTTRATASDLGVEPLAEILGAGQVSGPDTSLLRQPSNATRAALDRAGLSVGDVDLFEMNEAFAAVALASADDLGVDEDRVNVNGGAIALGHPIGMSGCRIVLTLAYELRRRGGGVGAASLCGGGGQGEALVLRVG
jgi:acetyl-CoA C-acetyltransferase